MPVIAKPRAAPTMRNVPNPFSFGGYSFRIIKLTSFFSSLFFLATRQCLGKSREEAKQGLVPKTQESSMTGASLRGLGEYLDTYIPRKKDLVIWSQTISHTLPSGAEYPDKARTSGNWRSEGGRGIQRCDSDEPNSFRTIQVGTVQTTALGSAIAAALHTS